MFVTVVSFNHINALVSLANEYCRGGEHTALGRKLLDANIRSYQARYLPHSETADETRARDVEAYVYSKPDREYTPIEGIKLAQAYAYQTCEWHNWPYSEANQVITGLTDCLIRLLPGYEAAPWAI